jgi:hypothetical protein
MKPRGSRRAAAAILAPAGRAAALFGLVRRRRAAAVKDPGHGAHAQRKAHRIGRVEHGISAEANGLILHDCALRVIDIPNRCASGNVRGIARERYVFGTRCHGSGLAAGCGQAQAKCRNDSGNPVHRIFLKETLRIPAALLHGKFSRRQG